jgi:hypothetical protein
VEVGNFSIPLEVFLVENPQAFLLEILHNPYLACLAFLAYLLLLLPLQDNFADIHHRSEDHILDWLQSGLLYIFDILSTKYIKQLE